MSDIVKWSLLASALIGSALGLYAIFGVVNVAIIGTEFARYLESAVDILAPYLRTARGTLNSIAGTYYFWDAMIYLTIMFPLIKLPVKGILAIYKWIFK